MITVHLQEKLLIQILLYPSVCGAHSVPGVIFVLSFMPLVYPLLPSTAISVIVFPLIPPYIDLSSAPRARVAAEGKYKQNLNKVRPL